MVNKDYQKTINTEK